MQNKVVKALRTLADRLEISEEMASLLLSTDPESPKHLSMLLRIEGGAGFSLEFEAFYPAGVP